MGRENGMKTQRFSIQPTHGGEPAPARVDVGIDPYIRDELRTVQRTFRRIAYPFGRFSFSDPAQFLNPGDVLIFCCLICHFCALLWNLLTFERTVNYNDSQSDRIFPLGDS